MRDSNPHDKLGRIVCCRYINPALERSPGVEPGPNPWQGLVLPSNSDRKLVGWGGFEPPRDLPDCGFTDQYVALFRHQPNEAPCVAHGHSELWLAKVSGALVHTKRRLPLVASYSPAGATPRLADFSSPRRGKMRGQMLAAHGSHCEPTVSVNKYWRGAEDLNPD